MSRKLSGAAVLAVLAAAAHADRGSIPFIPGVEIFEPIQRAMIAWNGEEEILLLSTDLRASAPTKVLEVLPLPSEPEVKKGDIEVFKRAVNLINSRIRRRHGAAVSKGRGLSLGEYAPPAGEVTFHKRIGAHDVSVVHVLNRRGFIEWVEDYLRSKGVENPKIPEGLKSVVGEYLRGKGIEPAIETFTLHMILGCNDPSVFDRLVLQGSFNILDTTSLTAISDEDTRKNNWKMFHGIAKRPEGEKHQVFRHDTIAVCYKQGTEFLWRTDMGGHSGKDRGRELAKGVWFGDEGDPANAPGFVQSYLDYHDPDETNEPTRGTEDDDD